MLNIFVRTLLIYFFLVLLMQLTGKRQIGQLQLSELICALLLSELAAAPISDTSIPLMLAVVPVITLTALEVLISFVVTKSQLLRRAFDGEPNIIVRKGVLDQSALIATRISLEELLGHMRLQGIASLADVDYAILEQNGQLSFLQKPCARAVTTADLALATLPEGIAHPLVMDGKLQPKEICATNKNEAWVLQQITKQGLSLADVFLFTVDDGENQLLLRRKHASAQEE